MERKRQFLGPSFCFSNNSRASWKWRFMRGQKSGSGQRVKIIVKATASPWNSESFTDLPSSVSNSTSGIGSPGFMEALLASREAILVVLGFTDAFTWRSSIQLSSSVTRSLKVTASPTLRPFKIAGFFTAKSMVIRLMKFGISS